MTARRRNQQGHARHRTFGLMQLHASTKAMIAPLVQRAIVLTRRNRAGLQPVAVLHVENFAGLVRARHLEAEIFSDSTLRP